MNAFANLKEHEYVVENISSIQRISISFVYSLTLFDGLIERYVWNWNS